MGAEVTTVEISASGAKSLATAEPRIDEQMMAQSLLGQSSRFPDAGSDQSSGVTAPFPDSLDYPLPKVAEILRAGRFGSWGAAAITTTLFAVIEAIMICILRTCPNPGRESDSPMRLFLILSYAGLILNASTTFTALILIKRLGNLTFRFTKTPPINIASLPPPQTGCWLFGGLGTSDITWNIMKLYVRFSAICGFMRADLW
ncbi:hypothetical protein FRB97_000423 [Tulasnella sp. 331]|nr:hypothetical protein FRB97_000423 [Tulasnella sp. 331]